MTREQRIRMMRAASLSMEMPVKRSSHTGFILWGVFLFFLIFLAVVHLAHAAEFTGAVGVGYGQNGVTTTSGTLLYGQTLAKWYVGTGLNITRHRNDATVDILSARVEAHYLFFAPVYALAFAGLGHSWAHGSPEDLAPHTIGHWGGGLGAKMDRFTLQIRATHWSNPLRSEEYGHNILSIDCGVRF